MNVLPEAGGCIWLQQSSKGMRGLHKTCMLPVLVQHLTAEMPSACLHQKKSSKHYLAQIKADYMNMLDRDSI